MRLRVLRAACNALRRFGARHASHRNVLPSRRCRPFVPMRYAVATPQRGHARSDSSDDVVVRRKRGASFARSVRCSPRRATSQAAVFDGLLPASARLVSFARLFFNPSAFACSAIAGWPWMTLTFPVSLSVRPQSLRAAGVREPFPRVLGCEECLIHGARLHSAPTTDSEFRSWLN